MLDEPWRIELLGSLQARQGERSLSRFRTRKTALLLAYLALHPRRAHARSDLIDLLWPESDPDTSRTTLRVALNGLRRQLEPPGTPPGAVLIADRIHVRLNPHAIRTDVAEFEAALASSRRAVGTHERARFLAQAVDQYQGELLPGYHETWIEAERQRLLDAFLGALRQLAALAEQEGDLARALDYAHQAVCVDSLRPATRRELIRLYAAMGHPDAARRQYGELERVLREDLGEAPSAIARAPRELPAGSSGGNGPRIAPHARPAASPPPAPPRQCPGPAASPPDPDGHGPAYPAPRLPMYFTPFFGREEEIASLQSWVVGRGSRGADPALESSDARPTTHDPRLVTLTGPGGSGKTRLAVEAAGRLQEALAGAIWFVGLAELTDARLIPGAVLDALRTPRAGAVDPLEQVVAALPRRPALLILDNFEHLVEEGAGIVRRLLERVPTLTCLVTSRQRLGLAGERALEVALLPTPVSGVQAKEGVKPEHPNARTPERLMRFPSVQLFVDRAQAVRPEFQVTARNAAAVAAVCAKLEGLPLAIELAAARAAVLTPAQMLDQLAHRFEFLVSRQRDALPRHRSLRATLDWTYRLLDPHLQRFFARLAVFPGSFTLAAALATCLERGAGNAERGMPADGDERPETPRSALRTPHLGALDSLEQLRAWSLLVVEEAEEEARYRLLETVREYAWEQLIRCGEGEVTRRAHARFYHELVERAEPELRGPDQAAWMDRLEAEHDNLRAALDGSRVESRRPSAGGRRQEGSGENISPMEKALPAGLPTADCLLPTDVEAALRLAGSLWRFWHARGHWREGRERLAGLLALPAASPRTAGRAKALEAAGFLAWYQAEFAAAHALLEESLAIRVELGDGRGQGAALLGLGLVLLSEGLYSEARADFQESLAVCRACGDRHGVGYALQGQGLTLLDGDPRHLALAHRYFAEALALFREVGDKRYLAVALHNLGQTARREQDYRTAWSLGEEALSIARELRNAWLEALCLQDLGEVAAAEGHRERARSLFEASLAIWRKLGDQNGIAGCTWSLGRIAGECGASAQARALYQESFAVYRKVGNRGGMALALAGLAGLARGQEQCAVARALYEGALRLMGVSPARDGMRLFAETSTPEAGSARWRDDVETALASHRQNLRIQWERGNRRGIAQSLDALGRIAGAEGDVTRQARLLAAAEALSAAGVSLPSYGTVPLCREADAAPSDERATLSEETIVAAVEAWIIPIG